jgi:hypothetical protein
MIVFTHYPGDCGWTFDSDTWGLDGGGKTLTSAQ